MNQENPYSAPEAGLIDQPDKPGKLYSQNQVLAATFFGSLICGALLLKHNFSAKKDELTGNIIFYSSIVLLVLLVATTWNISERANILISTLSVAADMLTAYMIYRYLLNSAFKEHIKKGGGIMSNWMVVLAIIKIVGVVILIVAGWIGYEVFIMGKEL